MDPTPTPTQEHCPTCRSNTSVDVTERLAELGAQLAELTDIVVALAQYEGLDLDDLE